MDEEKCWGEWGQEMKAERERERGGEGEAGTQLQDSAPTKTTERASELIHGDGLGQMAGFVRVDALENGQLVGKDLQGHRRQQGCQRSVAGDFDGLVSDTLGKLGLVSLENPEGD